MPASGGEKKWSELAEIAVAATDALRAELAKTESSMRGQREQERR